MNNDILIYNTNRINVHYDFAIVFHIILFIISQRPGSGDYETSFIGVCMHVCLCASFHPFYLNLGISFISEDIFIRFAANVYGYENLCK